MSAAAGAMKPVLEKLTSLLGDEHTLPEGSRSDIEFIVSELEPMHSLLVRLWEAEGLDVACKLWMMEVRELSYDMEDAIDDFIEQRTNTSPFEDLKKKVEDVSERLCEKWKTAETISNSSKPVVDPRARFLHEDASELVGMDELKGELIELLVQRVVKRRDASRRRIGIPHHGTTQRKACSNRS